tara:strand:- start:7424 stop:7834 length:411 start_codon:yes stop_codon:yes gene_type:complete
LFAGFFAAGCAGFFCSFSAGSFAALDGRGGRRLLDRFEEVGVDGRAFFTDPGDVHARRALVARRRPNAAWSEALHLAHRARLDDEAVREREALAGVPDHIAGGELLFGFRFHYTIPKENKSINPQKLSKNNPNDNK